MDGLILVTGAAGFIGSNIAAMLADEGADVVACDWFGQDGRWANLNGVRLHDVIRPEVALDWLAASPTPPAAIVHMGAISTTTETDVDRIVALNVRATLDLWTYAAIVHMGAISDTTETDVDRIVALNVRATLDLWTYAAAHGVRFIYASSAATYGDGSAGFVDDDSPDALARLRPLNAYGWSKHLVDRRVCQDAARGRPTPPQWAGLKFFNVYGPNEGHKGGMRSVVHQIYPAAARGDEVSLFASDRSDYKDGGQLRDFVYVKDVCAVVRAMLQAPELCGLYNVGSGGARSFADLARAVFTAIGREARVAYRTMPDALRGRYQYFTEADIAKLKHEGLAPNFHSLEAGVADYIATDLALTLQAAQTLGSTSMASNRRPSV